MPANPDTGREDESITLAQFLMQAVNSSIIWVQSLKCINLKSDGNRFCIVLGENVQMFNILWQVVTYYLIKYPVVADGVAFPARCCQVLRRWSEILATWLRGDERQQELSGWFSVSSSAPLNQCLLLSGTRDCAQRPSFRSIESGSHPYFVQTISFDFDFLDVVVANVD